MDDKTELLPCPFCGEHKAYSEEFVNPNSKDREIVYAVRCEECQTQTGWYDTLEEAITAWNTRTK